jgi:hypothetical protein
MSRIDSLMDLIGLGIKKTEPDPVTGTVSKLDEAILNMRQPKMQANQVENALMGMNAGVKRAEIQDTGLDRWLAEQGGSVTQRDIAEYLDQAREPIGVTRYQTEKYPPLESLPPLQAQFETGFGGIDKLSIARGLNTRNNLKSDDPAVFEPAAQDYRDWVVSRGGTPARANYIIEKYRQSGAHELPDEAWGNGQFSILDFSTASGYHDVAFENPTMGLDFTDPASGRRYQVEPTRDRSLYRTYEHTGNERKELRVPVETEVAGGGVHRSVTPPTTMDEALQAINARRIKGSDLTKYSHITDPGLDLGTYKEDVITLPGRGRISNANAYSHEQHWPGIENPLVHLRSSHRELDDGGFAIHVEELQSDWHQQARQKGIYWSPDNRMDAIDASEKVNRSIADKMSKSGSIETEVTPMVDNEFDVTISHVDPKTGRTVKLGLVESSDQGMNLQFFNDAVLRDYFPDMAADDVKAMFEEAAKKQMIVHNISDAPPDAPFKGDEWAFLGIKAAIKRAIDEGANGITLPNGEDMILKEGVMGDAKLENTMRKMYDEKLPSILKKIGKQYGVKPETRKVFYGEDDVERTFLPLTDEMIEKIMNEGMKKYGKTEQPQGILGAIGDMYA